MRACNNQIACRPFTGGRVDVQRANGVALPTNKNSLVGLQVLFGDADFKAGSVVYVSGEMRAAHWAAPGAVFEYPTGEVVIKVVNGKETNVPVVVRFMMVPKQAVLLHSEEGDALKLVSGGL